MPVTATSTALESIITAILADPGLKAKTSNAEIMAGVAAARLLNEVLGEVIEKFGFNSDKVITPEELKKISDYVRATPDLLNRFTTGHGDDNGNVETGFHKLQNDGGSLLFRGRNMIDTVIDAIYHYGEVYVGANFLNEDGNKNETVSDVAGWLNYFLNGKNTVFGGSGNDMLGSGKYTGAVAAAADEIFYGYGGNDKIWADEGNDIVYGGIGNDEVGGGAGNDMLYGEDGNDKLWGDVGNDEMRGGAGNDVVGGGAGNDKMYGDAGNDELWGDLGDDVIEGGAGNDSIGGGDGNNTLSGNDGNDTISGGNGVDLMEGGLGDDKIWANAGSDVARGGDGKDVIGGGAGNDMLYGDAGNDELWGDIGDDIVEGGAGDDSIGGGDGKNTLSGNDGNDTINGGTGVDSIDGGTGDDKIWAGNGNDVARGGDGNDSIDGSGGDDQLIGGAGNDKIYGGEGKDVITGGAGADQIFIWNNAAATDTLVFSLGDSGKRRATVDVVEGFVHGEDKIDLKAFGKMTLEDLDYTGDGNASCYYDGRYLRIDADGNGATDMIVQFKWVETIDSMDLILA